MVPMAKLGSWYLLMILSFVLVSLVHRRDDKSAMFLIAKEGASSEEV
jgi:uncharacterized membrane protein YoaT (DUF817 family)